jgi:hypothetical protein
MKRSVVVPEFWVTNLSNRNVTLADLNISVPARSSVNLLDDRHYSFTEIQLRVSAENGSIYNKRDKIVVRKVAPKLQKAKPLPFYQDVMSTRSTSIFEMKQENYEELNIEDEVPETDASPDVSTNAKG